MVILGFLDGIVGCTGSVQPCVDRHVCGIASTPLDATPVPQPNPINESRLSPIPTPIPTPAPQIKRDKQELQGATPPTPVPQAAERSFQDSNVQIAFLEPANTSKPDEPQTKPRTKPNPLALPPDLPGAEAPAIRVPPFNAPNAERASAIEQIYRAMPELAGSELGPETSRTPLALTELQQTAMCRNPLIRQAASDVEAARGQMIQAGTISNPHLSYEGDTINTGSTAGYQGINLQQSIPTGGKLRLAAAAAEMDLRNAELALRQARYDLATQVRTNYFAVLVAQENVKVSRALAQFAETTYRVQIGRVPGRRGLALRTAAAPRPGRPGPGEPGAGPAGPCGGLAAPRGDSQLAGSAVDAAGRQRRRAGPANQLRGGPGTVDDLPYEPGGRRNGIEKVRYQLELARLRRSFRTST